MSESIVFFDGVCGLCNLVVDRILRADRRGVLLFSPLQGETAARILGRKPSDELGSVVYWDGTAAYEKSEAILRIADRLGGWRRLAVFGRILPRFIRDALYDFIARNRYGWFGKKETCRLPSPEERSRFLP
jgi:predicted DCC family thiol-disulfide oxidoreductase YuxK